MLAGDKVRAPGGAHIWVLPYQGPQERHGCPSDGRYGPAGSYAWFHLHLFGGLTPYGVNVVYAQWNTADLLAGHFEFSERYYRLWGLFIDQRFGIGRWAPLLLAAVPGLALLIPAGSGGRLVLLLIFTQMLMATFVSITMMDGGSPGGQC